MMKRLRIPLLLSALLASLALFYYDRMNRVRIETVQFESWLVNKKLPYSVVLPPGYGLITNYRKRYPVIYLLHGHSGHYFSWLSLSHLADYAVEYQFIIAMPEGNNNWYTDSDAVATDKYETYLIQELIPDVQKRFRAIETREGRTIVGLSMGGSEALKFGIKHPDLFIFAGSLSGALGAPQWDPKDSKLPEWVRPSLARAYGPISNPTHTANDIFKIIREMPADQLSKLPFLYLDCGTEDFLIEQNRDMAALLLERKIPHEYRHLPGKHDWKYWDQQVQDILKIVSRRTSQARREAKAALQIFPLRVNEPKTSYSLASRQN